jgi:hypothetical protein
MTDDLAAYLDAVEARRAAAQADPPVTRLAKILRLTYDERVPDDLADEIRGLCASPPSSLVSDTALLVGMVRAVRALCDSYERSGYPDALIPKGQTIAEFRAALLAARP